MKKSITLLLMIAGFVSSCFAGDIIVSGMTFTKDSYMLGEYVDFEITYAASSPSVLRVTFASGADTSNLQEWVDVKRNYYIFGLFADASNTDVQQNISALEGAKTGYLQATVYNDVTSEVLFTSAFISLVEATEPVVKGFEYSDSNVELGTSFNFKILFDIVSSKTVNYFVRSVDTDVMWSDLGLQLHDNQIYGKGSKDLIYLDSIASVQIPLRKEVPMGKFEVGFYFDHPGADTVYASGNIRGIVTDSLYTDKGATNDGAGKMVFYNTGETIAFSADYKSSNDTAVVVSMKHYADHSKFNLIKDTVIFPASLAGGSFQFDYKIPYVDGYTDAIIGWMTASITPLGGAEPLDTFVYYLNNMISEVDDAEAIAFTAYPNPVQDILYVNAPLGALITVINFSGYTVKSCVGVDALNMIDVSDLVAGVYFLKVADESQILIIK